MAFPHAVMTLSLLTPFAAYLPAEVLQVSSVLAVVTTGLYIGGIRLLLSPATRIKDVIISCAFGSSYFTCPKEPATWHASHSASQGAQSDADIAEASLSNGYVSAGYAWSWYSNHDLCFMESPVLFEIGVSDLKIGLPFVCQGAGPNIGVGYTMELYVIGPAGVSY